MGEAARPAGDDFVGRVAALERRVQVLERMPSGQNTLGSRHIGRLPGARIYNTAAQTIANTTFTNLSFSTARWDNDGMFAVGSPTVLTVRTAGRYYVAAMVSFNSHTTGARLFYIYRNAVQIAAVEGAPPPTAGIGASAALSTVTSCAVGDTLSVVVYQASGAPLDVIAPGGTERTNELVAQWVGR